MRRSSGARARIHMIGGGERADLRGGNGMSGAELAAATGMVEARGALLHRGDALRLLLVDAHPNPHVGGDGQLGPYAWKTSLLWAEVGFHRGADGAGELLLWGVSVLPGSSRGVTRSRRCGEIRRERTRGLGGERDDVDTWCAPGRPFAMRPESPEQLNKALITSDRPPDANCSGASLLPRPHLVTALERLSSCVPTLSRVALL